MSDIQKLLTEHVDIWVAADIAKKSGRGRSSGNATSVYGIKKLRELILDLAVRGKLVPQDANDEPAIQLLKRVNIEQKNLFSKRKLKQMLPLREISEDEKPFDLPYGWSWVRLGEIAYPQAGYAFKSKGFNESGFGLPLVRIRDVGQPFTGTYFEGEYKDDFLVTEGDVLISMDGEFRVSKWVNKKGLLNQRVCRLLFFGLEIEKGFVAESLQVRLRELQGIKAYTTVDHLSAKQIHDSVIAIPPLAEQHRIVAKIVELMALCDQLETKQNNAIDAHEKLVSHLLGTLTQSKDAKEFNDNWQRIAAHFDILFTTEFSIAKLKQTILMLAVMGKLVPQDSNDEPANVLIKRIQAKRQLKEKIVKSKTLLISKDNEQPLADLPAGWVCARFGDVLSLEYGDNLPSEKRTNSGEYPVYGSNGVVGSHNICFVHSPCIVVGRKGSAGALNISLDKGCCVTDVAYYCVPPNELDLLFTFKLFHTLGLDSLGKGIKPGLSRSEVYELQICIPPLSEQHRIVNKVDELMCLCDQLNNNIFAANKLQQKLADVLVERAIE